MKLRTIHSNRSQRGAALITSMVVVMVVASLGATLIHLQSSLDKRHSFSIDRRRALYIAEAGVAEASLAISQGKSGIIGSEAAPASFGRGVYWVESVDLPSDRLALVCTAQIGSAEFVLRTIVVPNLNPVSSLGFFGTDGVHVGWGTVADGYHSGTGTYVAAVDSLLPVTSTGELALIGSNDDIHLCETPGGLGALTVPSGSGTDGSTAGGGSGGGTGASGAGTTGTGSSGPGSVGTTGTTGTTGTAGSGGSGDTSGTGTVNWGTALAGAMPPPPSSGGGGGSGIAPGTGGPGTTASGGGGTGAAGGGGGTVPTGAPTRIYGDLRPGRSGLVHSNGFSQLVGTISSHDDMKNLPPITLPPCTETISGNVNVTGLQVGIGTDTDVSVSGTILVAPGGVLRIEGPATVVTRELRVAPGAELALDDSTGPIQIYVNDVIEFAVGSTISSTALATSGADVTARGVSLFMDDAPGDQDRIRIEASGQFRGILYAPSDAISIPSGLRFVGSAVARHLTIQDGAHVTSDRRLSIGGDGVAALPRILSWQIVPIGDGLARRLQVDPILALKLAGVTPTPSAAAAPESDVEVQYVDLTGLTQTYNGPIAGLNMAGVDRVIGARWDDPRSGTPRGWMRPAGDDPAEAIDTIRDEFQGARTLISGRLGADRVGTVTEAQVINLLSTMPAAAVDLADAQSRQFNQRVTPSVRVDSVSTDATFNWQDWATTNADVEPVAAAPGALPFP